MKKNLFLPASLCLLVAVGCGKEAAPPPVGQLEISPKTLSLGAGEIKTVKMKWTPTAPLEGAKGTPTVFVHLLDDSGEVVRTFDHALPQAWTVGTPIAYDLDVYQSAIAPPLSPGKYRLTVGLFDQDNKRWALAGLGEEIAKREYQAAAVDATSETTLPRVEFPPMWMAAEEGGDRQVVARRWLTTQGAVRFFDVKSPGKAWMMVRIPDGSGEGQRLVVDDGSNTPTVLIRSTCGEVSMSLSGPGFHKFEIDVKGLPPGAAQACRVVFAPNFHLEMPDSPTHRSVSLENLAWRASGA